MVCGYIYFFFVDTEVENNHDFIPSEPWDDDNFCTDHVDEGHACSDVEESVNLVDKPRQVCSLLSFFPFKLSISIKELVYSTFNSYVLSGFVLFSLTRSKH